MKSSHVMYMTASHCGFRQLILPLLQQQYKESSTPRHQPLNSRQWNWKLLLSLTLVYLTSPNPYLTKPYYTLLQHMHNFTLPYFVYINVPYTIISQTTLSHFTSPCLTLSYSISSMHSRNKKKRYLFSMHRTMMIITRTNIMKPQGTPRPRPI